MTTNSKNQPIDLKQLPSMLTLCFVDRCPRKADCLRYQAQAHGHSKGSDIIGCIHPEIELSTAGCAHFASSEKQAYVRGIKKLFDQIPYNTATDAKRQLRTKYGQTKFYRMMRGEFYLSPAEQKQLLKFFAQRGIRIEQPEFDHTEWRYDLCSSYHDPSTENN